MTDPGWRLNLPPSPAGSANVELSVSGPIFPVVLSSNGDVRSARFPSPDDREGARQFCGQLHRMRHPDWRELRRQLIRLDLNRKETVARWLEEAGYVPDNLATVKWQPQNVTDELINWLRYKRDALGFILSLERDDFRRLISLAADYADDKTRALERAFSIHNPSDPEQFAAESPFSREQQKFRRHIRALRSTNSAELSKVDLDILAEFTNQYRNLNASFFWDRDGNCFVGIATNDPMEALIISAHLDRNFSAQRLVDCKNRKSETCKDKRFEQERRSGRFCSAKCRTYYKTNMRREKIRLIRFFDAAWRKLPGTKKKGQHRLEWIRHRAEGLLREHYSDEENGKLLQISPQWPELTKLKMRK